MHMPVQKFDNHTQDILFQCELSTWLHRRITPSVDTGILLVDQMNFWFLQKVFFGLSEVFVNLPPQSFGQLLLNLTFGRAPSGELKEFDPLSIYLETGNRGHP